MATVVYEMDEVTSNEVRKLRGTFGVRTNAGVLRKIITLAKISASKATPEGNVTFTGSGDPITVNLTN